VQESFLCIVESELVIEKIVEVFLVFEKSLVVLLLPSSLLHHACSTCEHLHLFNSLLILEQQADHSIKSVHKQEGPTHRGHVVRVEGNDIKTLLKHLFELVSEGERNLSCNETLEDVSDTSEHEHVNDTLNVLLQHRVHHVWVGHHVHWVRGSNLLVEIAIGRVAVVCFPCAHG